MVSQGRITFVTDTSIMVRRYLHETDRLTPQSVFYQPVRSASERLDRLLGEGVFIFPKDETVIRHFVDMATDSTDLDCIVLDFFAGSCTTAHAVFDLNKQDRGSRKCILVQLPEPCPQESGALKAGYKTIADICKERVRRVIEKVNKEHAVSNNAVIPAKAVQTSLLLDSSQSMAGLTGANGHEKQDRGFRVLKLDESSFKTWRNRQRMQRALRGSSSCMWTTFVKGAPR
jgi:hypothetical protein